MIDCIIIDDDINVTKVIDFYIKEYEPYLDLKGIAHEFNSGKELIMRYKPKIIFLDIQLYNKTGFELLEFIDTNKSFVIFITAYDEYALKAFENGALGYLLKPISPAKFSEVVTRIKNLIIPQIANKTIIKANGKNHILKNEQIYMVVSIGKNKTEVKTQFENDNIIINKTIGELEKIFKSNRFFRISQSIIINIDFIKNIDINTREVFLKNGKTLTVSHRKKQDLIAVMSNKNNP